MPIIAATWKMEVKRIFFLGQPMKKVSKTPPSQQTSHMVHTYNLSYMESIDRRVTI
jgi:hypothetical protein